jgi:hypothetical protein
MDGASGPRLSEAGASVDKVHNPLG